MRNLDKIPRSARDDWCIRSRGLVSDSCFIHVKRTNYRAYDMASIPPGVSMRAAVAVVCGLLSPLLLAATLPAQEPERVIRGLDFEGNKAIADEVLAAAISTTRSSWFARSFFVRWLGLGEKRYFDEEEFRRDVIRVHVLYRRSGFPNAKVDTTVRREPENV